MASIREIFYENRGTSKEPQVYILAFTQPSGCSLKRG
jgi:hypothetical protein